MGVSACFHAASAMCHGGHSHEADRIERLERQVAQLSATLQSQFGVKTTTGQGNAVFSWDTELTAAFPEEAKPFEKDMHGGFNEDSATGIVYTGIPGYGLCAISPDLRTWTKIGSDPRLKGNIHGLVCFQHRGQTLLALSQNEEQRVLLVDLHGTVQQELRQPAGGEFDCAEARADVTPPRAVSTPPARGRPTRIIRCARRSSARGTRRTMRASTART